jgi:4-hydroxybenzoyl-CoA reductase subunit beta
MIAAEKTFVIAKSIKEAIQLASENPETSKFIAGGTDLLVNKFQGNETNSFLIDITSIKELKGIRKDKDYLYIGSLTTLDDLKKSKEIESEFPVLIEAAHSVGTPLIRKTATLGGNILCENRCLYYNQSDWWREAVGYCLKCEGDVCIATGGTKACFSECVSDTAPALISMNAQIKIETPEGESIVPLLSIYTGDGVAPRSLPKNAIIKEIILPLNQQFKCTFNKLRLRESLEFTSLTSVVSIGKDKIIRITFTGVDPKPVYIETNSAEDLEALIKRILKSSRAIDNDMFTRNYRRDIMKVYITNSYKKLNLL